MFLVLLSRIRTAVKSQRVTYLPTAVSYLKVPMRPSRTFDVFFLFCILVAETRADPEAGYRGEGEGILKTSPALSIF